MADDGPLREASELLAHHLRDLLAGTLSVVGDDLVLQPEAAEIFELLGVTAVGCDADEMAIKVHLAKRPTAAQKKELPERFEDFLVSYDHETLMAINPARLRRRKTIRQKNLDVVMCGDSISPANDRSAGTFGALVRGLKDRKLYGLTCNHVAGGCNNMPAGMPIVSPGVLDVVPTTQQVRQVGRHSRLIALRQGPANVLSGATNVDAAIFEIEDPDRVSSMQGHHYDTPSEVRAPKRGMQLQKVGRTTGHTKGRIKEELAGDLTLDYAFKIPIGPDSVKSFQGVCAFSNAWPIDLLGEKFASNGDSGSLVVELGEDDTAPAAVGLLFSVGKTSGKGYILPLQPLLDALEVELVSGHNS